MLFTKFDHLYSKLSSGSSKTIYASAFFPNLGKQMLKNASIRALWTKETDFADICSTTVCLFAIISIRFEYELRKRGKGKERKSNESINWNHENSIGSVVPRTTDPSLPLRRHCTHNGLQSLSLLHNHNSKYSLIMGSLETIVQRWYCSAPSPPASVRDLKKKGLAFPFSLFLLPQFSHFSPLLLHINFVFLIIQKAKGSTKQ